MRRVGATEVGAAVVAVLVARLAINAGYRIAYPFLPEIARGLGISLGAAGALLALRSATGLAAPLVPRLIDGTGRRVIMLAGISATAAGCLLIAGAPAVSVAALGFALTGLAKPLFDIPMQGWFGQRVPYARRGRVLGITELPWALSLLLAVPAGFLIVATSWQAPFVLIAVLAAAGAAVVLRLMAADRPQRTARLRLRLTRPRMLIIAVMFLFRLAAELLFVIYGVWLEDVFGLSVAAIGVFTLLVVAAELAGEGTVAGFGDRIGLRRMILAGLALSTIAYAAFGLVGASLAAAIAAVIAWLIGFEVSIVATVPLVTELGGNARERLLSLTATVAIVSGAPAALISPRLYQVGGIALCGLVAAACAATATLLLARIPAHVRSAD